jgi:hypothetical protein
MAMNHMAAGIGAGFAAAFGACCKSSSGLRRRRYVLLRRRRRRFDQEAQNGRGIGNARYREALCRLEAPRPV